MTARSAKTADRNFVAGLIRVAAIFHAVSCFAAGAFPATGFASESAGGAANRAQAATSSDGSSWIWTAQRVALAVETDGHPSLSPGLVRAVRETVGREAQAKFGAAWKIRVPEQFDRPPPAEILDEKLIRIRLIRSGGEYVIEASETDASLRSTGPVVRRSVRQRGKAGEAAASAAIAAYRPTARIDDVRGDQAVLRFRGEALLPAEMRAELVARREGFVPLLRRRDRDGRVAGVDRVPWTVLSIRDEGAAPSHATIVSGLRSPLAGRRRGRVEALALATGKPTGSTVLSITGVAGGGPIAGASVYEVVAGSPSIVLGTTDDRGRITIAADDGRVRTLVVAGRYLPLARLPLVAGLDAEVSAPLPVDARLFEAERRLANVQSEFTDRLVLRRVLALTAATQLERGDKQAATTTLARLGQVGSITDFADSLESRRRLMGLGPSTSDRLIDRLYTEALAAMRAADDRQTMAELQKRLAEVK
jgi:hypothetical protein